MQFEIREQIIIRNEKQVALLSCKGKLDIGDPVSQLREAIETKLAAGTNLFLLEMSQVRFVSSSGIGEIVNGFQKAASKHGNLMLVNITDRFREKIELCKLDLIISIYDAVELALEKITA